MKKRFCINIEVPAAVTLWCFKQAKIKLA